MLQPYRDGKVQPIVTPAVIDSRALTLQTTADSAPAQVSETNLQEPLTIGELASKSGFSERSFVRQFQAAMETSPQDYYRALRLDVGKRLIENSDLSMAEVAAACGYETRGAFTRAFREKYGAAPSSFR